MKEPRFQVKLDIKRIYDKACPKCKEMIRKVLIENCSEQMVDNTLKG